MRPAEYEAMFRLEDHYWWFDGSAAFILATLSDLGTPVSARILDAGCGTGGLLQRLGPGPRCGIELAPEGVGLCRRRGLTKVLQASVLELPFRPDAFDVVLSIDVLVHQWVGDDVAALQEIRRVVVPGGVVLLQVAAHRALWSAHDVATLTRHRYTRRELAAKVREAGFELVRLTYRNSLLAPLAILVKLLRRHRAATATHGDLVPLPRPLDRGLFALLALENRLARRIVLPFGVSLFCVARKPGPRGPRVTQPARA